MAETYLRPFKLMKTGEVVQQPQTKTIKKGRLVGLPNIPQINSKGKEPVDPGRNFAGSGRLSNDGSSQKKLLNNAKLNATAKNKLIATHSASVGPSMLKTINDTTVHDNHAGQIINLQLNNHLTMDAMNNVLLSRKSSGEFRYLDEN